MYFLYRCLNLSASIIGSLFSSGSCFTGMGISFSARQQVNIQTLLPSTGTTLDINCINGAIVTVSVWSVEPDLVLPWQQKSPSSSSGSACSRLARLVQSSHRWATVKARSKAAVSLKLIK